MKTGSVTHVLTIPGVTHVLTLVTYLLYVPLLAVQDTPLTFLSLLLNCVLCLDILRQERTSGRAIADPAAPGPVESARATPQ